MKMCFGLATLIFLALLLTASHGLAQGVEGDVLVVSAVGPFTSIDAALEAAEDGDRIEVHGGTYASPLTIEKSVILHGIDKPIIDGNGDGSLVYINAPDVVFEGFVLRNSGGTMHREDAGIIVQAPRVTVADNALENVLFGIYFAQANDGIARGNVITGQERELGLRGDGIRVWYSNGVQIVDNEVALARDTLIWYSDRIIIKDNRFYDNRYGLHFMYSHEVEVRGNTFEENSVGAFLMYSQDVVFDANTFAYNRGASGYGLAFKDMDRVTVTDNFFIGNMVGIYLDNSPSLYEGTNSFTGNVFAYNDIGMTTLPNVERNIFQGNSFLDNLQQTSIRGREVQSRNVWSQDGLGNFWSDYVGYDENGDNIGETPYRADKLFERLTDEHPNLKLFTYSPASQAMEFAAAAFPVVRPQPRLVDEAPMMTYVLPAHVAVNEAPPSMTFALFSSGLIGGVLVLSALSLRHRHTARRIDENTHVVMEGDMILVENLVKKFKQTTIIDGLTFSVAAGESLALWGANGAGKTTTLRCLLGVLPFEGQLTVNRIDVRRDGKAARAAIGYVPQEVTFYDMTVRETLDFFGRLKKAPSDQTQIVLETVGLLDQAEKAVRALSGGMKQRLALAVALLSDPPILLLDEPTANLDVAARADFIQLVRALNHAGKTVIFSSHRLDEVMALAGRVLVLREGRVEHECHPSDLPERLGLQQWMRIWVRENHRESAVKLLRDQGFSPSLNSHSFAVSVDSSGKMAPLRALDRAQIPIENFDIINESPEGENSHD